VIHKRRIGGFPLYFGIEIQGLFKDFQGPVERNSRTFKHSSCFQVLSSLEFRRKKFKYFQGLSRMRENPGIDEVSGKEVAKEIVEINYNREEYTWDSLSD